MKRSAALLLAAALLLPALVARVGVRGPRELSLNLGPGDGPYTSGFTPPRADLFDPYEIKDQVATHWTTHDARIALPLEVDAPVLGLRLRFARHLPDRGHVEVRLAGSDLARLAVQKGYTEYAVTADLQRPTALQLDLHVEARDERNLGVSLDWVRFALPEGGRVRLAGTARWRPAATVLLLALLLFAGGLAALGVAALTAVASLALSLGLGSDPWLTHRLLTGVPEALAVLAVLAMVLRARLVAGGRVAAADFRLALVLFLAAFLPRLVLVNHPDYYYPDLMIHARIAKLLHRAGPEALLHPDAFLGAFQEARHSVSGMPYSIAFHVPFAVLDAPYDSTMTALRIFGALVSALPVVAGFALVRLFGLPVFGAVLLALAPPYPHWLFRATLPALLGHCVDLALILWLACHVKDLSRTRTLVAGGLLVATAQLTYAFALPVTALLVFFLAVLGFLDAPPAAAARRALRVLALGVLGAATAFALYYHHFVTGLSGVAAAESGAAEGSAESALARSRVVLAGVGRFFDPIWAVLALAGLFVLLRRGPGREIFRAWAATVLSLLLLRIFLPGLFRWNHEILLLTPLLCLAAAEALGRLAAWGRVAFAGALLLGAFLVVTSLLATARSFLAVLGHAR